jgi:hypothetical protein
VIGTPVAHLGGIPVEEALASLAPTLILVAGAASAALSARARRLRGGVEAQSSATTEDTAGDVPR